MDRWGGISYIVMALPSIHPTPNKSKQGHVKEPSYQEACSGESGHTEAVQVCVMCECVGMSPFMCTHMPPWTLHVLDTLCSSSVSTLTYMHTYTHMHTSVTGLLRSQGRDIRRAAGRLLEPHRPHHRALYVDHIPKTFKRGYDRLWMTDKHNFMANQKQENGQGNDRGFQYRTGIYTHTPEQLTAALASKDKVGGA